MPLEPFSPAKSNGALKLPTTSAPVSEKHEGAIVTAPESVPRRLLTSPALLARRGSEKIEQYRSKWEEQPSVWKKQTVRNSVLAGLGLIAVLYWLSRLLPRKSDPPRPLCDAHAAPGRLLVDLTSPLLTHWRPFDEDTCAALPSYLPALWELTHGPDRPLPRHALSTFSEDYQLVSTEPLQAHRLDHPRMSELAFRDPVWFLRKHRKVPPTVLVLGDSVDRNGLVHFCQLFRRNVTISHYHDITKRPPDNSTRGDLTKGHGPKFDGWDQRGLPHLCEIPFDTPGAGASKKPDIAMRVINGFHYGMDALDEFNTPDHGDWHKPGRVEQRIEELVVPLLEQMGGVDKVDVVQLHSGMWDLALFGMQDDKTKWSLTVPLSPEQLAWWQERMRKTIYTVRQTFPRARVVFRKLHRTDDALAGTQYITNLSVYAAGNANPRCYVLILFYFSRRVHQLRHLQEEVARSEGLPIFDFGHLLEGYQLFQEKVHPLLIPGGVVYAQNLIHQLQLALQAPYSWRKGVIGSS